MCIEHTPLDMEVCPFQVRENASARPSKVIMGCFKARWHQNGPLFKKVEKYDKKGKASF